MWYLIIGLLILSLSIYYDFNNKRQKGKNFWFNTLLIILIAIPALRYRVGGDTLSYITEYEFMPSLVKNHNDYVESRYQPLWLLFVALLKSISSSFVLLQIVHAIIVNSIIFYVIKKYCKFIFMAIFLYYIYSYFRFNFEVLREALSICIIALSLDSCLKKKWWKYIIYVTIAFMFHDSAIIMFFMPFLYNRKLNIFLGLLIVIMSIGLYFGANLIFNQLMSKGLISSDFMLRAAYYMSTSSGFSIKGILYYFSIHLFLPLFIFFIGKRNGVSSVVDGFLVFYIFVGLISSLIPGLYRFANYQIIFSIIYLSNFFYQIRIPSTNNRIFPVHKILMVCILSIVLTIRVAIVQFRDTSEYYTGTRYYNLYYPYYSIFNPVKYYPREEMVNNMWYNN